MLALCELISSMLHKVSDSSAVSSKYLIALCNLAWRWSQQTLDSECCLDDLDIAIIIIMQAPKVMIHKIPYYYQWEHDGCCFLLKARTTTKWFLKPSVFVTPPISAQQNCNVIKVSWNLIGGSHTKVRSNFLKENTK